MTDNEVISDIRRVAAKLNQNSLSFKEYLDNGGIYDLEIFDDEDFGSFANFCELAGVKAE